MQLAFCLYQYSPYGGMERNFLRTAQLCLERGHQVRVYVWRWKGPRPQGLEIIDAPVRAWRRLTLYRRYWDWALGQLRERPADLRIGFNRGPGLDLCYDADGCYAENVRRSRSALYRLTARCRYFLREEKALLSGDCRVLTLTQRNIDDYCRHYPGAGEKLHLLPPGVARDRRRPQNADAIRAEFCAEHGLDPQSLILLMLGSDYARKGLDRSLRALAAAPADLRERAHLFVLGRGRPRPFLQLARRLGVAQRLHLPGGRDDAPRFLFSADLLLHPARRENTGGVILEALAAGLPAIVSAACGYAPYTEEADAGAILTEPFRQREFNNRLAEMLIDPQRRRRCRENSLRFAQERDLCSRIEKIADLIEQRGAEK